MVLERCSKSSSGFSLGLSKLEWREALDDVGKKRLTDVDEDGDGDTRCE